MTKRIFILLLFCVLIVGCAQPYDVCGEQITKDSRVELVRGFRKGQFGTVLSIPFGGRDYVKVRLDDGEEIEIEDESLLLERKACTCKCCPPAKNN